MSSIAAIYYRSKSQNFWLFFVILVLVLVFKPSLGQDSLRIAAVVNDQVISVFDLESRLSLLMKFSQVPNNKEARTQLAPIVLRQLIDETIKKQEAKRLKIKVKDNEIAQSLIRFEKKNGIRSGQLDAYLKTFGLNKISLQEKLITEILWINLVRMVHAGTTKITDQDVNDVISEVERNKGKTEFLISEIFLSLDNPSKEQMLITQGYKILQELENGASFPAIANALSQSPTAAAGGNLGWVRLDHVENSLTKPISSMKPGQISKLIKTAGGFKIILLRDKRVVRGINLDSKIDSRITLYQNFFPIPPGAKKTLEKKIILSAQERLKTVTSCSGMKDFAQSYDLPKSGPLGPLSENQLAPNIRSLISNLPDKTISKPLKVEGGIIIAMVCSRETLETREQKHRIAISDQIFQKRLATAAEKYLSNLRRETFIDIRF